MRVNALWCEFELLVGRFVLASWEVLELGLFGRFAAGALLLSLYDWAGLFIIIWRGVRDVRPFTIVNIVCLLVCL